MNKPKENSNKISLWFVRITLLILAVTILTYFFPRQGKTHYVFQEGRPWNYGLLTAPFDIPIYKDDAQIQAERDSIMRDFRPIFKIDRKVSSQMVMAPVGQTW